MKHYITQRNQVFIEEKIFDMWIQLHLDNVLSTIWIINALKPFTDIELQLFSTNLKTYKVVAVDDLKFCLLMQWLLFHNLFDSCVFV